MVTEMTREEKGTVWTIVCSIVAGVASLVALGLGTTWAKAAIGVWKLEKQLEVLGSAGIDPELVKEVAKLIAETIQ